MEQAADEAMGTAAARLSRFLDRDDDGLDAVDWSDDRDTFRTGPGSGGTTPEDEDEDPLGLDELLRPGWLLTAFDLSTPSGRLDEQAFGGRPVVPLVAHPRPHAAPGRRPLRPGAVLAGRR